MRRQEIIPLLTVLGFISVGCKAQEPVSAVALPTLEPSPTPVSEPSPTIVYSLPTQTIPTPELFEEISPRFRSQTIQPTPQPTPIQSGPAPELTPVVESLPSVEPNDILGYFLTKQPQRLASGNVVPPETLVSVIIKPNGTLIYLSPEQAQNYYYQGAIIPPWISLEKKMGFVLSSDAKTVKGGPVDEPESSYIPIRHIDQPKVIFSAGPAVSSRGYIATIKNGREIDVGEFIPHHGGTAYRAPRGWRILSAAFGAGVRSGDLLTTMLDDHGRIGLYWLVRLIPEIPASIKARCAATNPLTHCEMEYIRDEHGKLRSSDQKVELLPVANAEGIFDAVVVSRALP